MNMSKPQCGTMSKIFSRRIALFGSFVLIVAAAFAFVNRAVAGQETTPAPTNGAGVVKTQSYVSTDPVVQGKPFQAAVVVNIDSRLHMNSHKPSDAYLIPTTLTPQIPGGFKVVDTVYPLGHDKTFPFSPDKPLNVYSGSVTLRLKLLADATAPTGDTTIPMVLRYQACNNSACLPPVKVPVTLKFQVAAAGTKSHPVHAEVFSTEKGK